MNDWQLREINVRQEIIADRLRTLAIIGCVIVGLILIMLVW